ncbi:1-acyl-sn-glycerol-3-phosphate acyltransferase [Chryseobacterium sp. 6424]|uniref:lysophospholipid acyltransferase family protein n=1 Tax=Chryseobacterium sp. 6424 TaxID=2039166 RepID=UPI000EFD3F22|nr:lysophospholipid acyltransferase family protein [Chryseobacterium sp. 6424]AYO58327.1 1-acyl-sn-glycerol-3-phosphate acyltransferase [Chryseobacterium sp. 6424]
MTRILNYIWRGWMVILGTVLTLALGIPVLLLSIRKNHYKYAYKVIRLWCYGMFYGMGFRYELIRLTDKKIDPSMQYVFVSNHTSIMDVMLPCILMPHHPLCYVGKKELVKIPVFGIIYKRVCVMVDRSSARSRAEVYRRCAERMEEGQSIVIFPEGGVPDDTSVVLDQFKDGAFILASKHESPLVVFTFTGLKEMFPFDHSKGHPGKVKVYLNDILSPYHSVNELKNEAHMLIKNVLLGQIEKIK